MDAKGIAYDFINYKQSPATLELVQEFTKQTDWDILLNKRGTTWRNLSEDEKENIKTQASAEEFLAQNNSAIKRPIIQFQGKTIAVGFDPKVMDQYNW